MDRPPLEKGKQIGVHKNDRILKEQFVNGINDDDMMTDIIREWTAIKKTNEVTSEQVLAWTRRMEAQRTQKTLIEATKENKDFNAMKEKEQKNNALDKTNVDRREMGIKYKYCESTLEPKRFPAYGRNFSRCGKLNYLNWVCRSQSRQVPNDDKRFRAVICT